MSKTGFLYDNIYLQHKVNAGHPECPERLIAIYNRLKNSGILDKVIKVLPREASIEEISLVHDINYIDKIKNQIESEYRISDPDMITCPKSFLVALYAVGGCLEMCDSVIKGIIDNGFCAIRPPGHHAEKFYSMGYCIFNNIAISVKYIQKKYGVKKIAIVDWDVHHGNGTQHIFKNNPNILFISLHEFPAYPGTGSEKENKEGHIVNIPLRPGCTEDFYLKMFDSIVVSNIVNFKPEIILVSSGFDAQKQDPLSNIYLLPETYYIMTLILKKLAQKYCNNKIVFYLEGGYNLKSLADSVENVMQALLTDS